MPYFPGPWFPKKDSKNANSLFYAAMLALLKPWHEIVENIEFYHECSESARDHHAQPEDRSAFLDHASISHNNEMHTVHDIDIVDNLIVPPTNVTEKEIIHALDNPFSTQEYLFADTALQIGHRAGMLAPDQYDITYEQLSQPATTDQINQFRVWEHALNTLCHTAPELIEDPILGDEITLPTDISPLLSPQLLIEPSISPWTPEPLHIGCPSPLLNQHQAMVHDIVAHHLKQHLKGESPPQRLIIVHGQGGTGKSTMLNTISQTFDNMGASSLLVKMAMSGVAASMIGGQTLHNWAALPVRKPQSEKWLTDPSKAIDKKRKKNIGDALWLTIDEKSMMTTPLLAHLSQATRIVNARLHGIDASIPFGGLNIILLGDFHQFPPVAGFRKELYNSMPPNPHCQIRRNLFKQFDIVIKLEEQMCIRDPV